MANNIDKLKELAAGNVSSWREKALWRKENKAWLDRSAKIAIRILSLLEEKGLTQKELASQMDVSPQYVNKIVKGKENLSLETISKLEEVLGACLISVPQSTTSVSVSFTTFTESTVWMDCSSQKTYTDKADWSDKMWIITNNLPKKSKSAS